VHAAVGTLAALTERARTGAGRRLEVSLIDAALASLVNVSQAALATGEEARRYGNSHASIVPYEPYDTASGWIAVAAPNDGLWRRLCEACERPDLLADPRIATNPGRVEHREAVVGTLAETFRTRTAEEWLARLDEAGVPAGKVRGVREAFEAAAAAGDPASVRVEHPTIGELTLARSPFRIDGDAGGAPTAPPLLGQHTVEVLSSIGIDAGALLAAEVAAGPDRPAATAEPRGLGPREIEDFAHG